MTTIRGQNYASDADSVVTNDREPPAIAPAQTEDPERSIVACNEVVVEKPGLHYQFRDQDSRLCCVAPPRHGPTLQQRRYHDQEDERSEYESRPDCSVAQPDHLNSSTKSSSGGIERRSDDRSDNHEAENE